MLTALKAVPYNFEERSECGVVRIMSVYKRRSSAASGGDSLVISGLRDIGSQPADASPRGGQFWCPVTSPAGRPEDGQRRWPLHQHLDLGALLTGRGLQIVGELAERFGWQAPPDGGPGKVVWVVL